MPSTPPEAAVSTEVAPEPAVVPALAERHVLSKGEIFSIPDIKIEWCEIPQWNGGVYVKGLTGTQRDAFERRMVEMKSGKRSVNVTNFRAKLIVACTVDSDDIHKAKLLFNDSDVENLGRKSAAALQLIYDQAAKMSGFSAEEVDTLVDELGNDPSDGSGSA